MLSQNIKGTLYDAEAPISGAKIMNVTSKSITSSDGLGQFEIFAKVNDTVIFSSLFHHTKKVVVIASLLNNEQVFELKKIVNELDEVEVQGAIVTEEMDAEEETKKLNKQFKTDVEKNPHLYRRHNANSGPIDILEIGRRVAKLFKRKTPKEKETADTSLSATELDTLFKTDKFFNDNFLVLNLNITKDYKYLFFEYIGTKNLPSALLLPENKIYLVDELLEYSQDFREILKESQEH